MNGYSSDLSGYIVMTELRSVKVFGHCLVCRISLETIDGFSPNLYRYTTRISIRADKILVTLTAFSRSQED